MMRNSNLDLIFSYLDEIVPNAKCELNYTSDFSLLIAVMLSAQTTDKKVNSVTEILFKRYPSLQDMQHASIKELQSMLKPLGMYQKKSENIIEISKILLEKYNGKVPEEKELLIQLPGVGVKTANVVRAEYFKLPELAVDTHVARVSKRLGLAKENDSVEIIEEKLRKVIDPERYIKTHHQFIHFGRYFCKAIKPDCEMCKLKGICTYKK